ncbi:Testin [Apis cerana cerana]|uniref:Testin n=1 Tax=Apis cerana cerana TaxID=94128 RepID=A0A2A3ER91_APICC|nr:Testin [Apis cerana cerana]
MNNTDINDRPKWLLELENRKRKPRLAHEAGAGAPCVLCKMACPGLDLHFWRKICKNCKCNKDDHDVDDDDFPQFDLLFGTSKKYKKKSICKYY